MTQYPFRLLKQRGASQANNATWDLARIEKISESAPGIFRLEVCARTICESAQPGQFVMLNFSDPNRQMVLPRPMAIHRRHLSKGTIELVIKVFGRGTKNLSALAEGDSVFVMGPLGRGFGIPDVSQTLVLSRGIGTCSVMTLGEEFKLRGINAHFVLSARTPSCIIGVKDCKELSLSYQAVDDASGNSSKEMLFKDLIEHFDGSPPQAIYTCGSNRLASLALALGERWDVSTIQVSVESHMACGLGFCHGCPVQDPTDSISEPPLVCVDGPVFDLNNPEIGANS